MTSFEILGREVTIPVEIRRARSWFATFLVPTARAAAVTEPSGLTPVRMPGGRSMLSLAFVRYEDGDLDPYNEVAVAFVIEDPTARAASPAGRRAGNRSEASPDDAPMPRSPSGARAASPAGRRAGKKGVYIHRLPVDQEFTCAAGREMWGFPKFVTPIEITESARSDRCVLTVDGAMALTMTVRHGVPAPMRSTALDAFSFADGVLRRTSWELRGGNSRMRPGGVRVELGAGEIAEELRGLGLPKRALMSGCVGHVSMTFQAAQVVRGGEVLDDV